MQSRHCSHKGSRPAGQEQYSSPEHYHNINIYKDACRSIELIYNSTPLLHHITALIPCITMLQHKDIQTKQIFTHAVKSIPYGVDPCIQIRLDQMSTAWATFHSFCKEFDCLAKIRAAWNASLHSHTYNIASAIVTASVWLHMPAIPPTVKWDPGHAEIALLGVLVQPLHSLCTHLSQRSYSHL